jgi:hypothetical protein
MKFFSKVSHWIAASVVALGAAGAVSLSQNTAHADNGYRTRHMIEVGSGVESAMTEGGVNVLLRVGYGYSRIAESSQPGEILGPEQLIWAHFTGDFAFDPTASGGNALPYADVRFIPVENSLSIIRDNGDAILGSLQLLPIEVKRDIRIDREAAVSVSVVGIQVGTVRYQQDKIALFAQVAADLVGYKAAIRINDMGSFHGFRLIDLGAEGGVAFMINENFTIRIALGGSADLNFGGNVGRGFAVQSDLNAYLALRADIAKFLQIFFKVGYGAACDNGFGCEGVPQIMAGITITF